MGRKDPAEKAIRDIRRKTRKRYSAEEKIRIVLSGLRGEESYIPIKRFRPDDRNKAMDWLSQPI